MLPRFILLAFILWSSSALCICGEEFGSLKGAVKYNGEDVKSTTKAIPKQAQGECHCESVPDESLIVDPATNGIKWVMVRLMGVKPKDKWTPPAKPLTLSQKGCRYTPHMLIVPPGTSVEIDNSGLGLNNFHSTPFDSEDPAQNFAFQNGKATYKGEWLKEPDIVQFKSDVYQWMIGYFLVHDPRYCAITASDGEFEIKAIPPGKYTLNLFQETLGEKTIEVEIKAGAVTKLGEIRYEPRK